MSFIREGSTKRKEILAKFLDLEIFEKKFKLAKEDAADMKGALRRLEGRDFTSDINVAETELAEAIEGLGRTRRDYVKSYADQINAAGKFLQGLKEKMDSIPAEIINIVEVKEELEGKKREIDGLTKQNENIAKTDRR